MVRAFLYVVSDQFSVFSPSLGELALPSEPIMGNPVPMDAKFLPVFGRASPRPPSPVTGRSSPLPDPSHTIRPASRAASFLIAAVGAFPFFSAKQALKTS